jgi:LuxR family quorum sensing-dependent transcriptional regulator
LDFITDQAVQFIRTLERVSSFEELAALMEKTVGALNIRYHSLYQFHNAEAQDIETATNIITAKSDGRSDSGQKDVRGVHNMPVAWVDRYMERDYHAINPVIRKVLRTKTAAYRWWSTLEQEGYMKTKRDRLVLSEAKAFGIFDGFVCPIVHISGDMVLVAFCGDPLDADPRLVPSLHLIALYYHQRFSALQGYGKGADVPKLAPQEERCLTLAAEGKTDWEISEIMSISESSVRTYLARAKKKFGVATRIQAAVLAKSHLLIHS